jgi:predicted ester cyclase
VQRRVWYILAQSRRLRKGWQGASYQARRDELYPDCVYRAPAVRELRGEAYKQFLTSVLAGFPDGRWTVEDQVAEGDKVVTRWSFTGIHRGNVMGIAPTGKQVTTSGVMIDRIIGGKIAEEWEEYDSLGMMQQLDAEPAIAKDKAAA